ncbi:uncharacterized protein LOC135680370 [Musa acuminata AAA Group]|uniref:uncharacterized protein LOC135680370 n=1 Tax=Musa acuminata AAA Group TaxID=214697 RepID=UPI0031DF8A9B
MVVSTTFLAMGGSVSLHSEAEQPLVARSLVAKASVAISRSTAGVKRDTEGSKQKKLAFLEIERIADIIEDFNMVLVIRIGLKMGKRKIAAAQCRDTSRRMTFMSVLFCLRVFALLSAMYLAQRLHRWEMCGQVKVVLKIESDEDRFVLQLRL